MKKKLFTKNEDCFQSDLPWQCRKILSSGKWTQGTKGSLEI